MAIATDKALLLCASPRNGNCLEAARLFALGFNAKKPEGAPDLQITLLRDYKVLPCVACGTCDGGRPCPLLASDDSAPLLQALLKAPLVAIAAPVYFYALNAQLKALLDRCQQYYAWKERGFGGLDALPKRKLFIMLSAARERGEQLFNGPLFTLKFALAPLGLDPKAPLMLRGLDKADDMARRPDYHAALKSYGAQAAELLRQD